MTASSCGCGASCPEPCAVTVNVTEVTWNGEDASFQTARFSRAAGTITADSAGFYRVITLPYAVAQPASVLGALNSGVQRNGLDYIVSGDQIFLNQEADADDIWVFNWFSTAATDAVGVDEVGALRGFAANPGGAWLSMDGTTSHAKATYAALWTYLSANTGLLTSSTATHFVLLSMAFPFYNGASVSTLQGYIHV